MTLSVENIKSQMESMTFNLGPQYDITLSFTFITQLYFNVHFLQRVKTSMGYGTVIGELKGERLYVWLDQSSQPTPLPYGSNLKTEISSFHRLIPEHVRQTMLRKFKNCSIKDLIAAGRCPLAEWKDINIFFAENALQHITCAEDNWSEWLTMAHLHFEQFVEHTHAYLQRHIQLPLEAMQIVGQHWDERWDDFPLAPDSCYFKTEIEGINQQVNYLQSKRSQAIGTDLAIVALLEPLVQERRTLLTALQTCSIPEAHALQKRKRRVKQEFEWIYANRNFKYFNDHSRIMLFMFNTIIEIQGKLDRSQQKANQAILLRLSEYTYNEALQQDNLSADAARLPEDPQTPYYILAFIFSLMLKDKHAIKKACAHLFLKVLCPMHVDKFTLTHFEPWCETHPQGVEALHNALQSHTYFNYVKAQLFANGQLRFQFEMAKFEFNHIKALALLKKMSPDACSAAFAREVLPILQALLLKGYEPAIQFVSSNLKPWTVFFMGSDYNLAVALIQHYERANIQLPNAWILFQTLETFVCANGVRQETLSPITGAMLKILFDKPSQREQIRWLVEQAESGDSEEIRKNAWSALGRAGQFQPIAALACAKYLIETNNLRHNKIQEYMRLGAQACPNEAAEVNQLFKQRTNENMLGKLLKSTADGHPLGRKHLETRMSHYVEEKNIALIDLFILALLKGKIQKFLSPELVVKTLILMIDVQESEKKSAYATQIMTQFIDALIKENPENKNTVITLLLEQAEGRFSSQICSQLRDAMQTKTLLETSITSPAPDTSSSSDKPLALASQQRLFAKNSKSPEVDRDSCDTLCSPGSTLS